MTPVDKRLDSTFALLRDPYDYISRQSKKLRSEVFQARLLLQNTIMMVGEEAAELFYTSPKLTRKGAMPEPVLSTLLGAGGVQSLDGAEHRHRKAMFMSLMSDDSSVKDLTNTFTDLLHIRSQRWTMTERAVLYDDVRELLTRAVCGWAGVPLKESEVQERTNELTALFHDAGAKNPKHLWSRLARQITERWAKEIIEDIRARRLSPPEESAAHVIAFYRDPSGKPLSSSIAAVELLNVLRPTVAVSVFIVFVAHALHQHRVSWERLSDERYLEAFVQEVRRFYPFFPATASRVKTDFEFKGTHFAGGTRVMLDLYGTNHNRQSWDKPEEFRPERFLNWEENLYSFIPQGGGNPYQTHRCPGEKITVELMKAAAVFLARDIRYDLPPQDLTINKGKLPALPPSQFVMTNVRYSS
jgi:fatty-acid peroxygenase